MASVKPLSKIQIELTKLLYQQIKYALWAESFAAVCVVIGLWDAVNSTLLISWLIFNLLLCGFARHMLVFAYERCCRKNLAPPQEIKWLILFGVGAFLSGISWGATGSLFMLNNDFLHQIFVMVILFGVTSASCALYSPNRLVFAVFLFPAFIPFVTWWLMQGGIHIIVTILGIIYMLILLAISFYSYKLIATSLYLGFENSDLVDDLFLAKESLEKRTQELEKSLSLTRATLEATNDAILVIDTNGLIEDYNLKFLEMFKLSGAELKNHKIEELYKHAFDQLENPVMFKEKMEEISAQSTEETFDELLFKDGRFFERYSYPHLIGNRSLGRVWSFRDLTGRRSLEAKLFQKANFDPLSGLPNRSLLLDRISQAISYAKLSKSDLAILFLDLDRFKLINDTLGHSFGDKLLKAIAMRLISNVNENDTVSREGGDEFIIILNALEDETQSVPIVHKILNAIREPFIIEGHKFNITISIGISFYPKDGEDPDKLIRNADIAMYHAKELGRNTFQFFTEDMNKKVLKVLVMENELRDALERKQFYLVYQPIINLSNGQIIGLEALLRWNHPNQDAVPPSDFISVAEDTGVIIPIGEWVLRTACLQAMELQKQGFKLQLSVNLSGRQFKQANFMERVNKILKETGLEPKYLSLELTESVIMDDVDKTVEILVEMKKLGITVAIDDFGIGYSSLNYLKSLPVDKLKIDRSFIQDLPEHTDDAAITAAIIALANKLNLIVVAEGVETQSQLRFLVEHHCDEMQGFYFSRPVDAKDCLLLLKQNKLNPFPALSHI